MVGDLVMERFRLLERIGAGGMGTVYRAFDERLQRFVAVKEIATGDTQRAMREAQAAARLNHPGIVTLYECGALGRHMLLVSELVAGSTLSELAEAGELADRDVAEAGADVCEALAHAHQRGVVHRDVKPQNVIVRDEDGAGRRAKLMDFGIASVAGAPTLTATGEVVGTLAYMSPEQADGLEAGPASDVYSLALTLRECWAGANPVRRATPAETAREIGAPVPSLAANRPDLPRRLIEVVDACLDPHPGRRPPLDALRSTLLAVLDRLDEERSVPAPGAEARHAHPNWGRRAARAGVALALAATVYLFAVPGERPGPALLLALLGAPSVIFASSLARIAIPGAAPLLGVAWAGAAYPALVAVAEPRALARFVLGAVGWVAMLVVAAVLDAPPHLGLIPAAPAGWQLDASTTADALLRPLLEPQALLGLAAFALGPVTLGWILAARHLAIALLGALLWAASLDAALRLVGDGSLGDPPVVVAASAAIAVVISFRGRTAGRPHPTRAPPPSRPAPGPSALSLPGP